MTPGALALLLVLGLIAHGVGDYVLQSDWMATQKTARWWPAVAHGTVYALPFAMLVRSPSAWVWAAGLLAIGGSHAVLDRYRVARYVIWARNLGSPNSRPWSECSETGFPPEMPKWMAFWLMVIVDNIIHVLISSTVIILVARFA